ncbi:hypothetical protein [Burkholderia ambifaria]|uniref:Uncharacterized protein n=1 Tax=Burkholderia ambifaria TaxID=152480 RepID=A0AA41E356_9BURK|nr:hypothetical protein [Burkholderia ambifaria]MBR8127530.1 hypothetical protein [Burkholderia ambifaria]
MKDRARRVNQTKSKNRIQLPRRTVHQQMSPRARLYRVMNLEQRKLTVRTMLAQFPLEIQGSRSGGSSEDTDSSAAPTPVQARTDFMGSRLWRGNDNASAPRDRMGKKK